MISAGFDLKIISREGTVYNGKVLSLTSYNDRGKFDILELHANFVSLIYKEIDIIDVKGNKQTIKIEKALLKNKDNNVEIYIGIDNISN